MDSPKVLTNQRKLMLVYTPSMAKGLSETQLFGQIEIGQKMGGHRDPPRREVYDNSTALPVRAHS